MPVGSKALAGQRQPVAGLDPRRDAGAGGARPADPPAHLGRAGPDRKRASAVRRRDHAGRRCPTPRERAAIEAQIERDQPIEDALAAASAALSGLSSCAGVVLAPKQELRLKQLSFVPLGAGARAGGAGRRRRQRSRTAWSSLTPGTGAAALDEVGNFVNARLSRPDAGRGRGAAARRDRASARRRSTPPPPSWSPSGLAAWSQDHARRPVLIVRGQANLIDDAAPPRIWSGSAGCSTSSRTGRRSPACSKARATRRAAASSSAARTGCSLLSGSSVIAAPYRGSQGQVVGVVGVIGPTRLNYARVVPMVDFTAKALTRLMA